MVQTRGQFGSLGSLLVVGIVIVMYLGFLSSNLVIGGEAIANVRPGLSDVPGIASWACSALSPRSSATISYTPTPRNDVPVWCRVVGRGRWIVWVHGLPTDFLTRNSLTASGFLGTVSTAALWQIAYAPYVSDYSRYMPRDTGVRTAFWATYWGCTLGSLLPMILGAMVGLAATEKSLVAGLANADSRHRAAVLIVFSVGVATTNAMNLYCGVLSS